MRNAKLAVIAVVVAAAALGAGCRPNAVGQYSGGATVHYVTIRKVAFDPALVTAGPGDTIVWENEDLVPHTVTARNGAWTSGNLPPGSRWRWVVAGRESAAYFCTYHTTMHGLVRIWVGR
jgi:plastocyanin